MSTASNKPGRKSEQSERIEELGATELALAPQIYRFKKGIKLIALVLLLPFLLIAPTSSKMSITQVKFISSSDGLVVNRSRAKEEVVK